MITERGLYSDAPQDANPKFHNHPTLLFSWWCTGCAAVMILFRLAGRKKRNNMLFREDMIMALSLIPLFIRMGLIQPVLRWGTNNAADTDLMSVGEIARRSTASRMVLGARIFYALFLWTTKYSIYEFLKRLNLGVRRKQQKMSLGVIQVSLIVTFIAVFIATLAECQPFDHYWQVVPDPGPRCRQGYAQLITLAMADIITNTLLIVFPIPIVLKSQLPWKRKISLAISFSLPIIPIIIAGLYLRAIAAHHSLQQARSVWASGEILMTTAVSNATVLTSFLRDRGMKRAKYNPNCYDSGNDTLSSRRRNAAQFHADNKMAYYHEAASPYDFGTAADLEDAPSRPAKAAPASSRSDRIPLRAVPAWQNPDSPRQKSSQGSDELELITDQITTVQSPGAAA